MTHTRKFRKRSLVGGMEALNAVRETARLRQRERAAARTETLQHEFLMNEIRDLRRLITQQTRMNNTRNQHNRTTRYTRNSRGTRGTRH